MRKKSAAITTFMLPVQCDLRPSAGKHNSMTHAPTAARNLDAAIPLRSAKTKLHNTIELPIATCKPQSKSQDTTGDQVPFKTPCRSHSIAICRHRLEKDNRNPTHYCRTHRCDAAVPMHKVPLPYSVLLYTSLLYSTLIFSTATLLYFYLYASLL